MYKKAEYQEDILVLINAQEQLKSVITCLELARDNLGQINITNWRLSNRDMVNVPVKEARTLVVNAISQARYALASCLLLLSEIPKKEQLIEIVDDEKGSK